MSKHGEITNELLLQSIIYRIPQFVFWKDKQSVFRGCNDKLAKLLGLSDPADIIGLVDDDLSWQPDGLTAPFFQEKDREVLQGKEILNLEQRLSLPGGKKIVILTNKSPIYDQAGEVIGVLGIAFDITEKKEYEKEIIKQRNIAEAANQAKSEFLANMSHDIRTPLSGIIGVAEEMVSSALSPEQAKESAIDLLQASKRLLTLLNEVLELARIEQGNFLGKAAIFSPKETAQEVIKLLQPSVQKKRLEFKFFYDESISDHLVGQRVLLHRILLNLLGNAIKFTEQGCVELNIALVEEDEYYLKLQFQVKDTGIGISKKQQTQVFNSFSRATSSYDGLYQGTGLGLSIVKQFVEAMDGEIFLESEENKGSLFTCFLSFRRISQVQKQAEQIVNKEVRKPGVKSLKQKIGHVLLVEDDPLAQKVALAKLKRLHESVDMVASGKEALEKMKSANYDLVYLDIGLPDIRGTEVAECFRKWESEQRLPETPLVALTAHVDEANKKACLTSGMNEVLNKPLSQEMSEAVAMRYIESCRLT